MQIKTEETKTNIRDEKLAEGRWKTQVENRDGRQPGGPGGKKIDREMKEDEKRIIKTEETKINNRDEKVAEGRWTMQVENRDGRQPG